MFSDSDTLFQLLPYIPVDTAEVKEISDVIGCMLWVIILHKSMAFIIVQVAHQWLI